MVNTRSGSVSLEAKNMTPSTPLRSIEALQSTPTGYSSAVKATLQNQIPFSPPPQPTFASANGTNTTQVTYHTSPENVYQNLINNVKAEYCKQCRIEVTDKCKALTCDRCNSWFHIACQNLSEYEYNFFKNNILPPGATQVNWFCSYCKNDQHPDKKAYDLVAELKTEVQKMSKQNEVLTDALVQVLDILKVNKKEVSQEVKQVEERVQTSVSSVIYEAIDHSKEKEEKECNVIIFNAPEAKKEPGKSKKEYEEEDHIMVNYLKKEAEKDHFVAILDKSRVERIGQYKEDSPRPRPIKVKLDSPEEKWFFLKKAENLKSINDARYKNISIQKDKTKMELMEDRRLKTRCTKMREETGKNYIIFAQNIMLKEEVDAFKAERKRKQEEERKARDGLVTSH